MDDLNGQIIKGYQLRERIGEGGFGAVYRAYQPVIEREVAIKVILREFANQSHFIRRFEFEARLIAQLEHPYIVPLYDYWREPGGAYLVMRVLRTSLRAELRKGRWTPEAAARLLDQITSALTVAHRHGVVHRDIKPDNILLDDEHNAYLADFGIALGPNTSNVVAIHDEGEIGSIGYVTPEQIRGEPLTAQTDLYSLGIVLYEMLTGRRPFSDDLPITDLIDKQLKEPVPPLDLIGLNYPAALNTIIQQATHKDATQRFPDALSMAAAFRQALTDKAPENAPISVHVEPENPYKGLRAFGEADAVDFYGREALVQRLLRQLHTERFLAVIGPSGSGKSSVVRAGLLPALRRGGLPGSDHWFVMEMLPGAHPLQNFQTALLSVAVQPVNLLDTLMNSDAGVAAAVRAILPADESIKLLLVIDQFEEVFTLLEDEPERLRFLNGLSHAVDDLDGRLRLVITIRADFVDRPLLYGEFGELIRRCNEFVLPLSRTELRQSITRPAERVGLNFEAELVTAITSDVQDQPGALPLLQYALTELFERREGRALTLRAYQASGGVLGSLARHAEDLYEALTPPQQAMTRQIFLRLVTLGEGTEDTRRRVNQQELTSLGTHRQLIEKVVEVFSKHRLLTFDRDTATRQPTLEIAHEALIRTWPRLREWLDLNREDLRLQRRLMTSAAEWINAGSEASFLASGARLDQFEAWAAASNLALNQTESQYLQASIAQRDAHLARDQARIAREQTTARLVKMFRRATIALGIVGAFALIGTVVFASQAVGATNQVNRANRMIATAQQQVANVAQTLTPIPMTLTAVGQQVAESQNTMEVLRLASEANKLLFTETGNVETAALLSIRALKIAYSPQADSTLRQSIEHNYLQTVFADNAGAIYSVAISPDGKHIATGSADGLVQVRDTTSARVIYTLRGHTGPINSVAYSPDGKYILSGSKDNTARLWDAQSGQLAHLLATRYSPVFQPGHTTSINSVTFSPDSRFALTSGREHTVRLWNVKTGQMIRTFRNTGAVWHVAFSPDGNYIVGSANDNTVVLWDAVTSQITQTFKGHTGAVWGVAYSPDGKTILTGSGDNTARLWDAQTGKTLRVFSGHGGVVNSVAYSPDGKTILTSSDDNTARLWDLETGSLIRIFSGHSGSVWTAVYAPDGRSVLTGGDDRSARLWDARPDQNQFIFARHPAAVWGAVFSPNGKYVLTGSDDETAQLWDAQTRQRLRTFTSPKAVYAVAFSPDSRYLAAAGADNAAHLWDTQTNTEVSAFKSVAVDNSLYSVVFSPDGNYLLTAGNDLTARLWNITTNALVTSFTGHTNSITTAVFSPDGKLILTGSNDHKAILWNIQTSQKLLTLEHTDSVSGAAFSPDGKTILTGSGDNTARLWNATTGGLIRTFVGHSNGISSVAFSPDGKRILTGSADSTVRLWDAATGKSLRVFSGNTNAISSVNFSPDGKMILASSADKTVRLWEVDYHDFITYACSRLSRDFTDDERLRFAIADQQPACPK